jgi:hypothetical protein
MLHPPFTSWHTACIVRRRPDIGCGEATDSLLKSGAAAPTKGIVGDCRGMHL